MRQQRERQPQVSVEKRQELCQAEVTLDGKKARVTGWRCAFARVTQVESGLSAEWAWETVERVVSRGGRFGF